MRILQVNNYHYRRGGVETHFFDLARLLTSKGHQVIPFSMAYEANIPTQYASFFLNYVDYPQLLKRNSLGSVMKVLKKSFYSTEAKKKIEALIKSVKPDVAHIHNIFQIITPSIINSIKKADIPIIWTLHDFNIICPAISFFNKQGVCEKCKGGRFYNSVLNKCKRNSLGASLVAALQSYLYNLKGIYSSVDKFIVPSNFLGQKMMDFGIDKSKILWIPNFIEENAKLEKKELSNKKYILYAGRLAPEKGLATLINAVKPLDCTLIIAGSGLLESELKNLASGQSKAKIDFVGYKSKAELNRLYEDCNFVVLPSECYENAPLGILEAFKFGKPVIGSSLGGIPELIVEGKTGLLFKAGNVLDLRHKISLLLKNKRKQDELGSGALKLVTEKFNPVAYYEKLIKVYDSLVNTNLVNT